MTDLISKSALIEAMQSSIYVDHKYGNWIYEDALLNLINSAPVVSGEAVGEFANDARTGYEYKPVFYKTDNGGTFNPPIGTKLFTQPQSARDALDQALNHYQEGVSAAKIVGRLESEYLGSNMSAQDNQDMSDCVAYLRQQLAEQPNVDVLEEALEKIKAINGIEKYARKSPTRIIAENALATYQSKNEKE